MTSATTVGTQSINTGSVCTTCGQTVKYDNQIVGLRALISF